MQQMLGRVDLRRWRRSRAGGLVVVVALMVATVAFDAVSPAPASAGAVGDLGFFTSAIARPRSIVSGPDGNLWFTDTDHGRIGRITPDGDVTTFADPGIGWAAEITSGPDGNLWFTIASNRQAIGRITPGGVVTVFTDPTIDPHGIAAGPDGNVWFTNSGGGAGPNTIGQITPAGVVTLFTDPVLEWGGGSVTPGPDGNVWFTVSDPANTIGRITPSGSITTFTDPGIADPVDLVTGPDGNLWFTNGGAAGSVGRITPAGAVTTFTDPSFANLGMVASGPDGKLWFAIGTGANGVGSITPAGMVTTYDDPAAGSVVDLTAGPDGNVWFSRRWDGPEAIGRMTPAGTVTVFSDPTISWARGITAGPDGNVWYANAGDPSIGRMSPAGVADVFTDPAVDDPYGITTGPDDNLWFTNRGAVDAVGRITPSGEVTTFPDLRISEPREITAGPDGNLWFVNAGSTSIGRITPSGVLDVFSDPAIDRPFDITSGPDGNLWFVNGAGLSLGRITPSGSVSVFTDPQLGGLQGITSGPGGAIWFASYHYVGRVTPDGMVTRYLVNDDPFAGWIGSGTSVDGIAAGRDGNLWIVLTKFWDQGELVRVTPSGVITRFPHPSIGRANDLTVGPDDQVWFTNSQGFMGGDRARSIGHVWTGARPDAPGAPGAMAGVESAAVSWTAPADAGSDPVTGYTVTAVEDPSRSCTWSAGPLTCTVSGLEPGTTYRFTVTATNAVGTSEPSPPSAAVVPTGPPGSTFHPVTPFRVWDSRGGAGPTGTVPAGGSVEVPVAGQGSVPADATAVVLNVTVTGGTAASYLTVYPAGSTQPGTANLLWAPGQTVPNLVTVAVGEGGHVAFANQLGTVDVVADVLGYYGGAGPGGDRFQPVGPARLLDSRDPAGPWGGAGLGGGACRDLPVRGVGAVPEGATAVVANVTVTGGTAASFLVAGPAGAATPPTANLLWAPGQTVANLVTVGLGPDGSVALCNQQGDVDVVVDVVGAYDPSSGGLFHPLVPSRVLDSRQVAGAPWDGTPLGAGPPRTFPVAALPATTTALAANVTVTRGSAASFLTVAPTPAPDPPGTANVLFAAGQTVPNAVVVGVGPGTAVDFGNQLGAVDVTVDLAGFFAPW